MPLLYSLLFVILSPFLGVSIGKHVDPVPMGYEELKTQPHERLPLTLEEVSPRRNPQNHNHILKTSQGDSWPTSRCFSIPLRAGGYNKVRGAGWRLPGVTSLGQREHCGFASFSCVWFPAALLRERWWTQQLGFSH